MEQIRQANNLDSNNIIVGQPLIIPTTATTSLYIVKDGDTLWSIANRYNVSVNSLIQTNNLTEPIFVGQQLRIPLDDNSSLTNFTNYTVKNGDNLYAIANQYNTTVDAIKSFNNLTSNLLSIGQILKIPLSGNTPNYQTYIVKKGDNLYSIAKTFGMSVAELMKINNLKTTALSIGQILKVTGNNSFTPPTIIEECYGTGYKEPQYITYTVKSGDKLYTIANQYDTTVDKIKKLNDLQSNNLTIGQVLKIKEVE